MGYDRATAEAVAHSLGTMLYFDPETGKISQHGPGEIIDPPKTSRPLYDDGRMQPLLSGDG